MRAFLPLNAALFLALAAEGAAGPARAPSDKQIAELVKQLGADDFDRREAASKALEAVGEPAHDALRKATTGDDLEVRRRAQRLLQLLRAQAEIRERRKWEGTWLRSDGSKLKLEGDRWTWYLRDRYHASGTFKIAQLGTTTKIDVAHTAGPRLGLNIKAIVRRRGADLYWAGTNSPEQDHPADFTEADKWVPVKK